MLSQPEHESYLWGSSAILCGYLLADAFATDGWELDARHRGEIFGLPMHKFTADGEIHVKPCAEAWLSDKAAEAILNRGIWHNACRIYPRTRRCRNSNSEGALPCHPSLCLFDTDSHRTQALKNSRTQEEPTTDAEGDRNRCILSFLRIFLFYSEFIIESS